MFDRSKTKGVNFEGRVIGGNSKIYLQSMTNTKTSDLSSTLKQINDLADAGCDFVRVSVLDQEDAKVLKTLKIKSPLPIIADIHFNFQFAIDAINAGIKKIRLNPGNLDDDEKLKMICELAIQNHVVIRIGINSGSLPEWTINQYQRQAEGMVVLAKSYIDKLNKYGFDEIVVSLKSSDVLTLIEANQLFAQKYPYPLHLGLTEAGPCWEGSIKSAAGLSPLLIQGIGNTIRISLTDDPIKEIYAAKKLLNTIGLMHNQVDLISCPTCGRLQYNMMDLVNKVREYIIKINIPITISILGCVVNGIGEGKHATIGVAGGKGMGIIFRHGKIYKQVKENEIYDELIKLIDQEVQEYENKKPKS